MNTPIFSTSKINIKAILSVFSAGMFIKTDLEKLSISVVDLAKKTNISVIQIEDILNDKIIISAEIAYKLSDFLSFDATEILQMQLNHSFAQLKHAYKNDINNAHIPQEEKEKMLKILDILPV